MPPKTDLTEKEKQIRERKNRRKRDNRRESIGTPAGDLMREKDKDRKRNERSLQSEEKKAEIRNNDRERKKRKREELKLASRPGAPSGLQNQNPPLPIILPQFPIVAPTPPVIYTSARTPQPLEQRILKEQQRQKSKKRVSIRNLTS